VLAAKKRRRREDEKRSAISYQLSAISGQRSAEGTMVLRGYERQRVDAPTTNPKPKTQNQARQRAAGACYERERVASP
jgi:hypothetical protein